MKQENFLQIIQEYVQEHPEVFEQAAIDIDTILEEAMKEYDQGVEKIKKQIINDPNPIENPETEMLKQVEVLKKEIIEKTTAKLHTYNETLEK